MRIIVIIACSFFCLKVNAQVGLAYVNSTSTELTYRNVKFYEKSISKNLLLLENTQRPIFYLNATRKPYLIPTFTSLKIDHAPGMFCKIECKIEAKSKLLPRFRLGSADYTDWMEGKRERFN